MRQRPTELAGLCMLFALGTTHAFVSPPLATTPGLGKSLVLTSPRHVLPSAAGEKRRSHARAARMMTQELHEALQLGVAALHPPAIHVAFADQGSNLAGKFFQASLAPYLAFLYFLKNADRNRVPALSFFGFQFLLLFVFATIPTGIISKTVYGVSLADVDWLHGSAEALLTVTNLLIVKGFKDAMSTGSHTNQFSALRLAAAAVAVAVGAAAATGHSVFGFEAHTPFLAGIGNLDLSTLKFAYEEPENALSVPTWAIHFSSVFEWMFAMRLVWDYSEVSKDESWKGLTWGMLPLHASGLAACTYHFFYNSQDLSFLVALQAGLTLLGNTTVAIAALRIALANGWKLEMPQLPGQSKAKEEAAAGSELTTPLAKLSDGDSEGVLVGKLVGATFVAAYAVKYGQLATGLGFEPSAPAALAMVLVPPVLLANYFVNRGKAGAAATKSL